MISFFFTFWICIECIQYKFYAAKCDVHDGDALVTP